MTIVVYTKPSCGGCMATKSHLGKLGLAYSEQPIEGILDRAVAAGITAAPVVTADDQMWGGYRPDRIKALVT